MIYIKLFLVFAKVGLFGFGGGMAMLPMIYQSAESFSLISQDEFSNLVAISQVTPGPIAVNAATYVGYNAAGFTGALSATLGVAAPSFILILIVVQFLKNFRDNSLVEGAFYGIRPVTVGLIASAAVFMAQSAFASVDPVTVIIFIITVVLSAKFKASPILIIVFAAIAGAVFC